MNVFIFGAFNTYRKDWLTYHGGTDRLGELCYNFSISKDFTQIENSPTWIPDYGSHSPTLLDLFLSSEASICSVVAFPPLETLIMLLPWFLLTFLQNQKLMSLFTVQLMEIFVLIGIIWVMFLEKISLNSVLVLLVLAFVSVCRLEWMYISLILNIRSSFTCASAGAMTCKNHFFRFYWQNKSCEVKVSTDWLVIVAKGFLVPSNLPMLLKQS